MNMTIISKPIDPGVERARNSDSRKDSSDGREFADVLGATVKDGQPAHRQTGETTTAVAEQPDEQIAAALVAQAPAEQAVLAAQASQAAVLPIVQTTTEEGVVTEQPSVVNAMETAVSTTVAQVAGTQESSDQPVETADQEAVPVTERTASSPVPTEVIPVMEEPEAEVRNTGQTRQTFFGFQPSAPKVEVSSQAQDSVKLSGKQVSVGLEEIDSRKEAIKDDASARHAAPLLTAASAAKLTREAFLRDLIPKPGVQLPNELDGISRMLNLAGVEEGAVEAVTSVGAAGTASAAVEGESTQDNSAHAGIFGAAGRTSFEPLVRDLEGMRPQVPEHSSGDIHSRIIDQVAREVRLRQFQGQSDIMVKLNPPELGAIRLEIVQTAEGLTSRIHASSEQVKNLLQAHLPALIEALSDAGLRMDQVQVTSGASFGSLLQDSALHQRGAKSRRHGSGAMHEADGLPGMVNSAGSTMVGETAGYSWLA